MKKIINGNFIIAIGYCTDGEEISNEEYEKIKSLIANSPKAPDGYYYGLTTDLEWELVEVPIEEQPEEDTEATTEDYEVALTELGRMETTQRGT